MELRHRCARPVAEALHAWMVLQRARANEGSSTARALDYSLRRWVALTRYLNDPRLPVDNNWCENQIRLIAVGRGDWLFAGSARADWCQPPVMSLIQSAKLNEHDPYAYLKHVLNRLPRQPVGRIEELHRIYSNGSLKIYSLLRPQPLLYPPARRHVQCTRDHQTKSPICKS